MCNYAVTCKAICSYNLVFNRLMQLLPLKSSVFAVHFSNTFWHGNETFPKGSSQNEIVPLLVIFHLPYSKYRGVKICCYFYRQQNQNSSLVSQWCRSCSTRVAFVSFVLYSCCTCVALVLLVSHTCPSCRTLLACVWYLCCKLDQVALKSKNVQGIFEETFTLALLSSVVYKSVSQISFNFFCWGYKRLLSEFLRK